MKGYQKLILFKDIIGRDDFIYVIDNYSKVADIINYFIRNPNGQEKLYDQELSDFASNLDSFCKWINVTLDEMKKGWDTCDSIVLETRNLLRKPAQVRKMISGGYCTKWKNTFFYGLSQIYTGIRFAFNPMIMMATNITKAQMIRFMFDKKVGLGSSFKFNMKGPFAITTKICNNSFTRRHMKDTLKALKGRELREKPHEFTCWGNNSIRIHLVKSILGAPRIYRVYRRDGDHDEHERDLNMRIKNAPFVAA